MEPAEGAAQLAWLQTQSQELQRRIVRMQERHDVLREVQAVAVSGVDATAFARQALEALADELACSSAALYLRDADGAFALAYVLPVGVLDLPAFLDLVPVLAGGSRSESGTYLLWRDEAMHHLVPISHQGSLLGAMMVQMWAQPAERDDLTFLYDVSTAVVTAVALERAEGAVRLMALRDPLTLLPNRQFLLEHLKRALVRMARAGSSLAVFFVDLDRFKSINDTHGHRAGDAVLVETARRLERAVRAGDLVGRLGGDEFVALVEAVDDVALGVVRGRIEHAFVAPFDVRGRPMSLGASIGVVLSLTGSVAEDLLEQADAAMYQRKRASGRG